MKTTLLCRVLILIASGVCAWAQTSTPYEASLTGAGAVPPNASSKTATGRFDLFSDSTFQGAVYLDNFTTTSDSIKLFSSSSSGSLGTFVRSVNGTSPFGGAVWSINTPLTPGEISDLQAGNWWVVLATPSFPNGEIRGQIHTVPEPQAYALMAAGLTAICFIRKKQRS